MNTNDLYLEYARVIKMCEGTELEDRPWACVRWRWVREEESGGWRYVLGHHPDLGNFEINQEVDFAVAVVEGRPVFVGDTIYGKDSGVMQIIQKDSAIIWKLTSEYYTWTPPHTPPKRTFTLNGVDLPCPDPGLDVFVDDCVSMGIEINGYGESFAYASHDDAEKVFKYLKNLLTEERDKT